MIDLLVAAFFGFTLGFLLGDLTAWYQANKVLDADFDEQRDQEQERARLDEIAHRYVESRGKRMTENASSRI